MQDDASCAPASLSPDQDNDRSIQPVDGRRELRRAALAASVFFLVLCSYYILRPVRDEMAVQFGAGRLQWLFTATFIFTLMVVPLFGWVARVTPRSYLLPLVYIFLVINLVAFYVVFRQGVTPAAAAVFFVWLSVFNLFVVSLFWSRVGDCFSTGQSHRLYGYIAAGGTAGALAGPAITVMLAKYLATGGLLVLSAALLALAAVCMTMLRGQHQDAPARPPKPIGGSVIAGIPLAFSRPDLRAITLLVLCYTAVSTVLYIEVVSLVGERYGAASDRTRFFATVDLAVNALALLLQILGTRNVVQHFGLRITLSVAPFIVLAGLAIMGYWASAVGLAFIQVLHRAGEYALGKPGREMVYTTVDAESRYKAKNFIDTAVYRAGDAGSAWVIAAVRSTGLESVFLVGLPAAALWLMTGFKLGERHDRHTST